MPTTKNRIVIYIIVGLVAVLAIGAMITMNSGDSDGSLLTPTGESIAELLSLGQRYLLELNYEAAIVTFTRVIEIDPMNVDALVGRGQARVLWQEELDLARADFERTLEIDERSVGAYLGLVDIYIRLGDFERALELARLGYEMTDDTALREMVEALEGGTVRDSEGRVRRTRNYADGEFVFYRVTSFAQGRITSITTLDPSGNVISHIDHIYDEQGNVLQRTISIGSATGQMGRVEYTYNSAGQLVREDRFRYDGTPSTYVLHEYGADGVLVRSVTHIVDEERFSVCTYDSQGHRVRNDSFRNGQLTGFSLYENDVEGRVIRHSSYHADGTLIHYVMYERDGEGRETIRSVFNADGTPSGHSITEYDDEGRILSRTTYDSLGRVSRRTVYN